ncbi:MAG TPA: glycosyltransferase 87 family protein, partial [Thermoanaerobaculia bacterium]
AAFLILIRGYPVVRAYIARFRTAHHPGAFTAAAAVVTAILGLLFLGVWRRPKTTAAALGAVALLLTFTSHNAGGLPGAAALAGFTLLAGDGVTRLFRGREALENEIATSMATGSVALGAGLLLLGEAGLVKPLPLAAVALIVTVARWRRIPALGRLLRETGIGILSRRRSPAESLWIAIVLATTAATFIGVLRPEVSYDALSYHLPEARDLAESGRVRTFPQIPESRLWHNYDIFLGGGFLVGGEKSVRFLHFLLGLAVLGSVAALARQLGKPAMTALVVLAIAAFPAGFVQLQETYVDLFAGLCLTAAAVELAGCRVEPRRVGLAGFLFGGAVATKIFSLLGGPALLIFLIYRRRSRRSVLGFAFCALVALAPWFAWSQSRFGFFLSPYSDPVLKGPSYLIDGTYAQPRPRPGFAPTGLAGFLKLPFARTFREVRLSSSAEAVAGFLPILLLLGAAGWGRRRFALFGVAALAALVPWYLLSGMRMFFPTIRFLISLYPLYAVFTCVGLARLTDDFRGHWGAAASMSIAALSIAFPAQFFSTPYDMRIALGRISREQALAAYLPAYPLWRFVGPHDRVLFVGEWDRYHCPASYAVKEVDLPIAPSDSSAWRSILRKLEITHVLYRADPIRELILPAFDRCAREIEHHESAILYSISGSGECKDLLNPGRVDDKRPSSAPQGSEPSNPDAPPR